MLTAEQNKQIRVYAAQMVVSTIPGDEEAGLEAAKSLRALLDSLTADN